MPRFIGALLVVALILQSCNSCPTAFEPMIPFSAPSQCIKSLPTPFHPLQKDEMMTLWGKELYLGVCFAEEQDWYRAITAFKSSLFLLPKKEISRRQQVEFYLCLSYYFAYRYKEAYETYEDSSLYNLQPDFPAKRELYLMLVESYEKCNLNEKAETIKMYLPLLDQVDHDLGEAVLQADFTTLYEQTERPSINCFLSEYSVGKKSVEKAKNLQAILPGAGYWYVGLRKAAVTSFIINSLFLAAGFEFWKRGYYAASLITFSLETGWYFGGINGAGLAANEHNERLYENLGKEVMFQEKLFPLLRFEYAF